MMVKAHRNPVVGAEEASRTERMLSAEVGTSVLDRGQGVDEEEQEGGQRRVGKEPEERRQDSGRGQMSEPTKQNDQGGSQLVDKRAIDVALARAARGESPDAIIEDEAVVNNIEDDQEEALRQAREEERNNNREKQKGYLLGWG